MKSYLNRTELPRGIRNNNPGNLIITNINWSGKIPVSENTDKYFEQFTSVEKGIRAMAMDLINDIKNGLNTPRKLISEYAPPFENNTASYINYVAQGAGIGIDDKIVLNKETLKRILQVIIKVENGDIATSYITANDIDNSIQLLPAVILSQLSAFTKKNGPTIIAALFFCSVVTIS